MNTDQRDATLTAAYEQADAAERLYHDFVAETGRPGMTSGHGMTARDVFEHYRRLVAARRAHGAYVRLAKARP